MRLRVDLLPRPPYGESVVVLIDVLRATTSITMLLQLGAKEVWVSPNAQSARATARAGDLLLGEKEGIPPQGFHYGTSPLELEKLDVAGKKVFYTSDNLPRALRELGYAGTVYLAAFNNVSSLISRTAQEEPESIALVCAGFKGVEALDDSLAAGFIVRSLQRRHHNLELSDAARLAAALLGAFAQPLDGLWESASGRFLHELGYADDLAVASLVHVSDTLPVLSKTRKIDGVTLYRFTSEP